MDSNTLTEVQIELVGLIEGRDPRLAAIFKRALFTISDSRDAASMMLASHGIRTVLNELEKFVDTPVKVKSHKLGDLIKKVSGPWQSLLAKKKWPGDPKWDGAIDPPLKTFLERCEEFFVLAEDIRPSRNEKAAAVIRQHSVGTQPIPAEIESHKAKEWMLYLEFFNGVAHLETTTERDFIGHLESLEDFLVNILKPKTRANRKAILDLIAKGEKEGGKGNDVEAKDN